MINEDKQTNSVFPSRLLFVLFLARTLPLFYFYVASFSEQIIA